MHQPPLVRRYSSLQDYCHQICRYNRRNRRYSRLQYQEHLSSRFHVVPDASVIIESQIFDENPNINTIVILDDSMLDFGTTESIYIDDLDSINTNNEQTMNFSNGYNEFTTFLHSLSTTESAFYLWYKIHGNQIPRESMRALLKVLKISDFNHNHIPTEYHMKKLDTELENICFKIHSIVVGTKSIFFLPISEIITGMMKCCDFQKYILISNEVPINNYTEDLNNYYGTIKDCIRGQKFLEIISNREMDTLYIGLIVFSDDFGKLKRSAWIPIDAVYLAFMNLPLKLRFLHHNVFIFSIIDNFPFHKSIRILQDSIIEFNNQNIKFHFYLVNKKFKIKVFVQLFACDNPRTMGILNLSMGKPNMSHHV